jgi:hypothetical protein
MARGKMALVGMGLARTVPEKMGRELVVLVLTDLVVTGHRNGALVVDHPLAEHPLADPHRGVRHQVVLLEPVVQRAIVQIATRVHDVTEIRGPLGQPAAGRSARVLERVRGQVALNAQVSVARVGQNVAVDPTARVLLVLVLRVRAHHALGVEPLDRVIRAAHPPVVKVAATHGVREIPN